MWIRGKLMEILTLDGEDLLGLPGLRADGLKPVSVLVPWIQFCIPSQPTVIFGPRLRSIFSLSLTF